MPSDKKRLAKIVDAVSSLFDYEIVAKDLRKKKALRKFIERLEKNQKELEQRAEGNGNNGRTKKNSKRLHLLKKQIRKAKKLLSKLGG